MSYLLQLIHSFQTSSKSDGHKGSVTSLSLRLHGTATPSNMWTRRQEAEARARKREAEMVRKHRIYMGERIKIEICMGYA